jgi:hypothetical protein
MVLAGGFVKQVFQGRRAVYSKFCGEFAGFENTINLTLFSQIFLLFPSFLPHHFILPIDISAVP